MLQILNIIKDIAEPSILKLLAASTLLWGFFFGDIHTQAILAVLMLMIMDTILGIMACYYEGVEITSQKFGRVVKKGIVYFMGISAGFFADQTINLYIIQATMIAFIGVTEFISILENTGRMGYKTPQKLLNQLRDIQSSK